MDSRQLRAVRQGAAQQNIGAFPHQSGEIESDEKNGSEKAEIIQMDSLPEGKEFYDLLLPNIVHHPVQMLKSQLVHTRRIAPMQVPNCSLRNPNLLTKVI